MRNGIFDAGSESAIGVGSSGEDALHKECEKEANEDERDSFKPCTVFELDEV